MFTGDSPMTAPVHGMIAVVPCNNLERSERFYARLGFLRDETSASAMVSHAGYRILSDGRGAHLHLVQATEGWLTPGQNPFGLYFYVEDVDQLARMFAREIVEAGKIPEHKPWGMYEFSVSDPDEALVRIGWPSRLKQRGVCG
jgi:catechol 2,3-dioxygenase-like lactoylglutathione lyase family enzyme